MPESSLTIGVLGGMGPTATIDLLQRIIRLTPALDDVDHIRTLVDNNPQVPSRINYLIKRQGENPAPVLVSMAESLESMGADLLVMPCNTAHLYAPEIESAVSIRFLNMVELTVERVATQVQASKVGLLASTAIHQTKLYESIFADRGVATMVPDDALQFQLMKLIMAIKAGDLSESNLLQTIVENMLEEQAECVVIACTELSALVDSLDVPVPVIDASQCLAEVAVQLALGGKAYE
ncbi:MAG: amino acid racemase [Gammaproteobacteria bacterium]|nr:amino acid racemase [Gammaproteobacteria bacterium]